MPDTMTCPGCQRRLGSILRAYDEGLRCPECGLSHETTKELLAVQERFANSELAEKYRMAVARAETAEAEVGRLRAKLQRIRDAVHSELETMADYF